MKKNLITKIKPKKTKTRLLEPDNHRPPVMVEFSQADDSIKDLLFKATFQSMMERVYENNVAKGFYDDPRSFGDCISLMHSELSEALEADRHGNPKDEKVPEYENAVVELADCVIRIMDTCQKNGWDLPGAILAKHRYNTTRPYKHGKKY